MSQPKLVVDGPLGRIEMTGQALSTLVVRSAESVAGIQVPRPKRQLRIAVEPQSVQVVLGVEAMLGAALPELGEEVQRSVATAVRLATGLATGVDVTFEELS
jgi:uncharacterized alkaline shock family protein YloU